MYRSPVTLVLLLYLARVQIEASAHENNGNLVYVDCEKDDLLFGEKLQSIVSYAMSAMGVDFTRTPEKQSVLGNLVPSVFSGSGETTENAELNFEKYCQGLGSKLGPYEPYSRNMRLSTSAKHKVVEDMKKMLPRPIPEFNDVISLAADHVQRAFEMTTTELGELFYNTESKEVVLDQFVVFKIFKAGDNLEISPCLMKVKSRRDQGKAFLGAFEWANSEVEMKYEERKYILTKFMIQQIIKKLEEKDYGF